MGRMNSLKSTLFDIRTICQWHLGSYLPKTPIAQYACFVSTAKPKNSTHVVNQKITYLIRTSRLEEAKALFDRTTHRDTVTWNSMLSGYVQRREMAKARKLFDEMPERDFISWNTMISGYARNGRMDEAFRLFDRMPERNVVSWNAMISGFLQNGDVRSAIEFFEKMPERDGASVSALVSGFIKNGELDEAAGVLLEIGRKGDDKVDLVYAYNTLISGYARNGRMDEAFRLFDRMPERSVVSWNAMISGFLQNGDVRSAIEVFEKMPERDGASVSALVSGLIKNRELDEAAGVLLEIGRRGDDKVDLVRASNTLIAGYGQRGRVDDARILFDQMLSGDNERFKRNVVSWNTMIICYVRAGHIVSAREIFDQMMERDTVSWNTMIRGYICKSDMEEASNLFRRMPNPDMLSWNSMISGFSQVGNLELARDLFQRMPQKNQVSWNSIIAGCERNADYEGAIKLFTKMQLEGEKPDRHTLTSLLSVCAEFVALHLGMQIHQLVTKIVIPHVPLNNSIITMYARCGAITEAKAIFDEMRLRNVISWNAMISGFLQNGDMRSAIEFFEKMPERDGASVSALVSGFIKNGELDETARVLLESGRKGDDKVDLVHAYNTLIAGYVQRGRVDDARILFDQMLSGDNERFIRNVVSWNTMITCYVRAGRIVSAREIFDQMMERDTFSWNTMISGYISKSDMEEASNLFRRMPNPDMLSWNSMISGFAQVGNLELARDLFQRMPQKNQVSWNSIIAGCGRNADYEGAIKLFTQMQLEGEKPGRHTLTSLLSVCAEFVALHLGMQIHQLVTKIVIPDVPLNNSIITMYARCGAITEAKAIFDEMRMRNVISWNAMIGGYASHGFAEEALELFGLMKKLIVQPTYITFISVLSACARAGLVDQAKMHFKAMVNEFGIQPRVEHFASLVDVVGRHGQVKDAMDVISRMPFEPDKAVWGALLGACRIHNNVKLARVAAEALMRLEPESSAPYVMLYNLYADVDQWADATEVRMLMEKNNIRKEPAYSRVDLNS